ncbi:MAG TPA: hypothetical protein VMU89_01735 [Thermomicrobiaceae bacterium]|nr:hypothetical protein [Thermomicrobiaceae bacterium]
MSLPAALTWAYLFPTDTAFVGDVPEPLQAPLAGWGDPASGRRVLVSWGQPASALPDLAEYAGLVAVNPVGLSPARLAADGFGWVRSFAVVPSLGNPRLFVPLESGAVASAAFILYTPYRASARLLYAGVRLAARSGLAGWYRDRVILARRETPELERIAAALFPSRAPRLAVSSGPLGPDTRRKPAIVALDPAGRPLAYGKIPGSTVSRGYVENEAATLPALAERFGDAWRGPRLLFAGTADGTYLTLQSPVSGRPPGPELTSAHLRFLNSLGGGTLTPATATTMYRALAARGAQIPDVGRALERVEPVLHGTLVPATIAHGDFLPWNLRLERDEIVAFDWENATLDGLPLFDELNHRLLTGNLVQQWSVDRGLGALHAVVARAPLGLRAEQVHGLAAVYLAEVLARLLDLGHGEDHELVAWYRELLSRVVASIPQAVPA